MTRKPIAIEVAMPSGPEHYWREMRARGAKGFTVSDIALSSEGVTYQTVKSYVWFLSRNGYLVKVGSKKSGYGIAHVYKIKQDSRKAPIDRPDPTSAPLTKRQALWTAMRTLSSFTVSELAACASTEERLVSRRSTEDYVRRLVKAGLIEVIEPSAKASGWPRGARAGVYRLKRAANTGPLAAKLCNANFVFDPNMNRVLGEPIVTEARP